MAKKSNGLVQDPTDWDRLEKELAAGKVRGARATADAELDSIDDAERETLQRLATRSMLARQRSKPIGNAIFLHGITGSDLFSVANVGGKNEQVWVKFLNLVRGRIERLKLTADGGKDASTEFRIIAAQLNKRYYARAVLALRARWDTEPFAYDWRKDIDIASDELAELITRRFNGQPVHLVAHSMGGLVARNMIRRHPALWKKVADPSLLAGGRLVMLGTPNYGSFSIVQAMTGEDRMMALLEKCDIHHNLAELLGITNTFLGSYQLLPSPDKLPTPVAALYQADTWRKENAISQRHLNRAYEFHTNLAKTSTTIDPTRMVYVASCRRPTIASMRIAGRGDFEYQLTHDGDGRVPHALGLLNGVPTFYVDEVHGDLARNESVLAAVDEILERGKTSQLDATPLRLTSRSVPNMQDYRTATDRVLISELTRIADVVEQSRNPDALPEKDQRFGEDALIRAALGSGEASRPAAVEKESEKKKKQAPTHSVRLRVVLQNADIREIKVPVIVVGHYRGINPIRAIGAIDDRLQGWITRAVKHGMIAGSLGETFFVPVSMLRGKKPLGADAVIVAGMGDFGAFTEDRLRVLMSNVAIGVNALGVKSLATVVVGSGEGSLPMEVAATTILDGIGVGLASSTETDHVFQNLKEVNIVELDAQRCLKLNEHLAGLERGNNLSSVDLTFEPLSAKALKRARKAPEKREPRRQDSSPPPQAGSDQAVSLTIESPDNGKSTFRFSALSRSAVIPVREVTIDGDVLRTAGERLQKAGVLEEQQMYGQLLYEYIVPQDFHEYIDSGMPVRFVVDRTTAAFPWEMACYAPRADASTRKWLGLECSLSRQFRTTLSRPPGTTPPLNDRLRVLVVADPAPEPELQLPFARLEGRNVVEALRRLSKSERRIDIEARIGATECDKTEVLAQIMTGEYDVVHFAGHGVYDPAQPAKSGWVFGWETFLTATDIFRARRVPRLIFANACFSGVVHTGPAFTAEELSKGLASLAQAFFERGVPNFIGSGWPVNDNQAARFAVEFYQGAVERSENLGKAVKSARTAIFRERIGSTWGAYQHYGNPGDVLMTKPRNENRAAKQTLDGKSPQRRIARTPRRRRKR